ncbi:hypothetical protein [Rhizobium sp. SSA_523]|uniref:hypothetical protein n=1 Tax=Rhizobium sp. SSA_523 TaxID=2952477 RepID=UPI002091DBE1|nr:hypothetical protein [Rhizobium sp. SSA_523]MCO5734132.1 hypothetical protein [Rhizobium sp. SSA_523]WKC24769.1 hypothetical protein QTJ18_12135 [Rhizobium sp. SSA_523]
MARTKKQAAPAQTDAQAAGTASNAGEAVAPPIENAQESSATLRAAVSAEAQGSGLTDTASVVGPGALAGSAADAGDEDEAPIYQPEKTFTLFVKKPVSIGSFRYLPRHSVLAKGSLINSIIKEYGPDAIRSAEPS